MFQSCEEYSQGPNVAVFGVNATVSMNSGNVGSFNAVDNVSPGREELSEFL